MARFTAGNVTLAPTHSALAQLPQAGRLALFDGAFPRLVASAWERLCRKAVPHLSARLGSQHGPAARYWRGAGPEWDLVAESLDGNRLLVGEAKWLEETPTPLALTGLFQELLKKGVPPSRRGNQIEVRHALFVPTRPRAKVMTPPEVEVFDARDVLEVLV